MSNPSPERKDLEDHWRERLADAKLRMDFARNYMLEVRRDYSSGEIAENEERFALQKAQRAENLALAEYDRVLRIYTDLTVNGIIPDETHG